MALRMKWRLIAGLALLLFFLAAADIALAQGTLRYFVPQQVASLTEDRVAPRPSKPKSPRWMTEEQINQLAGFVPLVPKYLPSGCRLLERFYDLGHVYLIYDCVVIIQTHPTDVAEPPVGEDSVQQVSVNGQSALFINGIWQTNIDSLHDSRTQHEFHWVTGADQQLVFEKDDLLITLMARMLASPKEDMIKIAEALQ